MKAARLVSGRIAIPEIKGRKCDFWDVWHECGPDAVRKTLAQAQPKIKKQIRPKESENTQSPLNDLGGSNWPTPQTFTAKLEPAAYPLDALPNLIREAVEEVAGFVKAPLPLVACSALGALSLAAQAHVDIKRAERLTGPVAHGFLIKNRREL